MNSRRRTKEGGEKKKIQQKLPNAEKCLHPLNCRNLLYRQLWLGNAELSSFTETITKPSSVLAFTYYFGKNNYYQLFYGENIIQQFNFHTGWGDVQFCIVNKFLVLSSVFLEGKGKYDVCPL